MATSTSTATDEAIAANKAVACALDVQQLYEKCTWVKGSINVVVDSKGLHRCLATHRQPRDLSTGARIHQLRMDYEDGIIGSIVWIPENRNPADAITKPLPGATAGLLDDMLSTGLLMTICVPMDLN